MKGCRKTSVVSGLVLALLALLAWGDAALAADEFYAGKTVNMIVATTAGGGQDTYARRLARHLGRNIPGSPNVVVQNMPGAGGVTAVQWLDTIGPQDGTAISTFNAGLVASSIVNPDKVKVNFSNFSWLGTSSQELRMCYVWAATGVKTWDELMKKDPVIMGVEGSGGTGGYIYQRILKEVFGVKLKQVFGYPGAAEKKLAAERGELDGECGNWTSLDKSWVAGKRIYLMIKFQDLLPPGMPREVPFASGLVTDPEKKQLLDLFNSSATMAQPFIVSKAVPADRLAVLRESFNRTMKDPQYIADVQKQGGEVTPIAGEEIGKLIDRLRETSPGVLAAARDVLGEGG